MRLTTENGVALENPNRVPKVQTPVCKDADAAPISQAKGQGF